VIIAEDLAVKFGKGVFKRKIKALDGLNLEVKEGDFLALIGQNGAGKSTAMYCFLGLLRPSSGSVTIFGKPPELGTDIYERIAYLPEEPHYHTYLTVEEAVTFYSSLYRRPVSKKRIKDTLEMLGLAEFKDLRLDKCSKGMKQKVGIAQCLIQKPSLLFLDEPTRGLDPLIVKEFRDILVTMHKEGATIVMNSHVLSEIEMVANRVAIIDKGKLVVQDSISKLVGLDTDEYVVEFEPGESLPEYFNKTDKTDNGLRGTIPDGQLYDFMDYTKAAGLKVFLCAKRKNTLEDSYISILKGGKANA